MARMIYLDRPIDALSSIPVSLVNTALTKKTSSRSLYWVQWALAEAGSYAGPVTGQWNPETQTALEDTWGQCYGVAEWAPDPAQGKGISYAFLSRLLADYLDAPYPKVTNN